jgi:hypothetical protein
LYANITNFNPWIIYKDPYKSKSLESKNIKRFINKFLDDIVANCPDGYDMHLIFKVNFSTANSSKELIMHHFFNNEILDIEMPDSIDRIFSNIEIISRDDATIFKFEVLNRILVNINYNINYDSIHDRALLDFDYMFIMYRYYPNRTVSLTKKSPLIFPELSKRHYSTAIPHQIKKQPWLNYEDPLNSIDLNKITIETFLFNFFRDIISSYPNGQLISLMFKVRYYANIDDEGPKDLKMFRHKDYETDSSDFIIRSFSKIQKIEHILDMDGIANRNIIKNLLNVIMFNVYHNSDNYNELSFKNMYISYQPIDNSDYVSIPDGVSHATTPPTIINNSEVISLEAKHIKPTMDIETWSDKINFLTDTSAFFTEDNLIYTFVLDNYSYTCKVIDSKYNLVLKFRDSLSKDVFSQGGLDTFTREIIKVSQNGKEYISNIYFYVNGVKTHSKIIKPGKSKFIINKELEKKNSKKK